MLILSLVFLFLISFLFLTPSPISHHLSLSSI
jgi:ankyrin repeat protein